MTYFQLIRKNWQIKDSWEARQAALWIYFFIMFGSGSGFSKTLILIRYVRTPNPDAATKKSGSGFHKQFKIGVTKESNSKIPFLNFNI